jgi:hypothetical protein
MSANHAVRTSFLTGAAGTGKTYTMKQRQAEDPGCLLLCATTGVAAVNLDTVTINSVLQYYDTDSLIDKYVRGYVHKKLREIAAGRNAPRDLVIDEVSMMHAEQLDIIYKAIMEVNMGDDSHAPLEYPLGLTLTGDFCQLPPVKGRWAFKADCWGEFAATTTRLTKVWRQADPGFLEAINYARAGDGGSAAAKLRALGAQYSIAVDMDYEGTTIVAKNAEADRFNSQRLLKIPHPSFALETKRWGVQSSEWKNIPDRAIFKPTALVMLLANKKDCLGRFQYVNGDQAHIVEYSEHANLMDWKGEPYTAQAVYVTSVRTGESFWVERIVRENTVKDEPDENTPFTINEDGRYVIGWVDWFPMRLGYCSTVHKSQGLSLDRVQIDCRDGFFGAPSMAYVALSRTRTIAGMRIVGDPSLLARRVKFNPEVREWL